MGRQSGRICSENIRLRGVGMQQVIQTTKNKLLFNKLKSKFKKLDSKGFRVTKRQYMPSDPYTYEITNGVAQIQVTTYSIYMHFNGQEASLRSDGSARNLQLFQHFLNALQMSSRGR